MLEPRVLFSAEYTLAQNIKPTNIAMAHRPRSVFPHIGWILIRESGCAPQGNPCGVAISYRAGLAVAKPKALAQTYGPVGTRRKHAP